MKLNPDHFKRGLLGSKRNMFQVEHGDNLSILKKMNPNQFDSMVTDPPAGIGFMGKDWDKDKGSRDQWIAWLRDIMREAYRVMKPGAYGVVWGLPRTSHWTAMALEDAGFDIRDCIVHLFGSGFPKSHDISKAIDRELGADRETTGYSTGGISTREKSESGWGKNLEFEVKDKPATAAAAKWNGFGTALKPAFEGWFLIQKPANGLPTAPLSECWWLIQKPIAADTIAKNVLEHGVGGLNIDASRIEYASNAEKEKHKQEWNRYRCGEGGFGYNGFNWEQLEQAYLNGIEKTPDGSSVKSAYTRHAKKRNEKMIEPQANGRFPSNLILSHDAECELVGEKNVGSGSGSGYNFELSNNENSTRITKNIKSGIHYGTETVGDWRCTETCAVRLLDEHHSVDNVSRFFYTAKPSRAEKNYGLEQLENRVLALSGGAQAALARGTYTGNSNFNRTQITKNFHPTVKPLKLMQYLIKLVTPPGGTVLDPFMGSGTTGVAAIKNGFKFYGIDQDKQYTELAINRLMSVYKVDPKLFR